MKNNMKYFWTITKIHFDDLQHELSVTQGNPALKGINPSHWSSYDGDGNCSYEGMIYGDYSGFEPLDDFTCGNVGDAGIKYKGEWL